MKIDNWKRRFTRALIVYSIDISIAITGWVYGFGLEVKNWYALIFLCIFTRFIFHVIQMAYIHDDVKAIEKG